jgi:hypothetical protein
MSKRKYKKNDRVWVRFNHCSKDSVKGTILRPVVTGYGYIVLIDGDKDEGWYHEGELEPLDALERIVEDMTGAAP